MWPLHYRYLVGDRRGFNIPLDGFKTNPVIVCGDSLMIIMRPSLKQQVGLLPDVVSVGERSNFKKNPTHTQDHGDA